MVPFFGVTYYDYSSLLEFIFYDSPLWLSGFGVYAFSYFSSRQALPIPGSPTADRSLALPLPVTPTAVDLLPSPSRGLHFFRPPGVGPGPDHRRAA